MPSPSPVPQRLALSACLLVATSLLHAQGGNAAPSAPAAAPATPAAPQGAAQAPQSGAPGAPGAGRAGQMQLSSATPVAETENLDVYPAAPEGFNVARENIPHGEVKVVETTPKRSGCAGCCGSTPPRATPPTASFPCSISSTAWATPAPNGRAGPRSDHHRQSAG